MKNKTLQTLQNVVKVKKIQKFCGGRLSECKCVSAIITYHAFLRKIAERIQHEGHLIGGDGGQISPLIPNCVGNNITTG